MASLIAASHCTTLAQIYDRHLLFFGFRIVDYWNRVSAWLLTINMQQRYVQGILEHTTPGLSI